jgi:hypothetical protein
MDASPPQAVPPRAILAALSRRGIVAKRDAVDAIARQLAK